MAKLEPTAAAGKPPLSCDWIMPGEFTFGPLGDKESCEGYGRKGKLAWLCREYVARHRRNVQGLPPLFWMKGARCG